MIEEYIKPLKIGELTAKLPLIQGGMGVGVSLSSLAGAVAAEGGIGVLSTAQIGFYRSDFEKNPLAANLKAGGFNYFRRRTAGKSAGICQRLCCKNSAYCFVGEGGEDHLQALGQTLPESAGYGYC